MSRAVFLGVHQDGSSVRSVLLRKRFRSGYRILSLGLEEPTLSPGVPWGTTLPADCLSIKVVPLTEGAESWRESELENIEGRKEPQGKGASLTLISVSAQKREVNRRALPLGNGEPPSRLDAEPLALWAARQVLGDTPPGPYFILHGLLRRWILLYGEEGLLRYAGHLTRPEEGLSPQDLQKIRGELARVSRAMIRGEDLMSVPVELSGEGEEALRALEERLRGEGWSQVRRLKPSNAFRRRCKGVRVFPMTHLIALGTALRGLEAEKGSPLLTFSQRARSPARSPLAKSLRVTAALLLVSLLASAFSLHWSVQRLDREAARLRADLSRYTRILPPSSGGAEPAWNMLSAMVASYESEVNRLNGARYPSVSAVELLALLSETFSKADSFELKEVSLEGESILLSGSFVSLERVDRFQQSLQELPSIRSVTLLSVRTQKDRVEARFRLLGPPWHGSGRSS